MSSSVANSAKANATSAQNLSNGYNSAASSTGSTLTPLLTQLATHPQGYSPSDLASMNTAAMQSAGGSTAGITGQANQTAARTNNAGGYGAALDQAARQNAAQLSDAALSIQNQNAGVKLQQQQEGISGLESTYGTQVGAGENALGLSDQALGVENQANQTKLSQIMAPFQIASGLGNAAGSILQGVNH